MATGGYEITGRSDGVLNPSGVRFGSAEIYNVIEKFPYVADSVCVGQRRPGKDSDERVLLFAQMREGEELTDDRITELKDAIAQAHSKRHVPAHIFPVTAVPVTLTGKKTEIAIKSVVCGQVDFKPSSVSNLTGQIQKKRLRHHILPLTIALSPLLPTPAGHCQSRSPG